MNAIAEAVKLKQELVDWVYDAKGDLAIALEAYTAEHSNKANFDLKQQNLLVDSFLIDGRVGDKTPLQLYLEQNDLSDQNRALIEGWQRSFIGLFEITQLQGNGGELFNWLTAKRYRILIDSEDPSLQPGAIILTRIAPIDQSNWMIWSDYLLKGKLSKPKLAVAIGEFKNNYANSLYSDAPQLLQQAWESVKVYHDEFVEFFGGDRATLSGKELNYKLDQLQEQMTDKRLAAVGIDADKSLQEMLDEADADSEELIETAADLGGDAAALKQMIESKQKVSMIVPKVNLPPEIRRAEQVTVFSHPRWGQMYVTSYTLMQELLAANNPQSENLQLLLRKYLQDAQINYHIWQQLKQEYPAQLEAALKTLLNSQWQLSDLDTTLSQYDKPIEPVLPEIASVPEHLHDLFQEAVAKVQKTKTKTKKAKKSQGFG